MKLDWGYSCAQLHPKVFLSDGVERYILVALAGLNSPRLDGIHHLKRAGHHGSDRAFAEINPGTEKLTPQLDYSTDVIRAAGRKSRRITGEGKYQSRTSRTDQKAWECHRWWEINGIGTHQKTGTARSGDSGLLSYPSANSRITL